MARAKVAFVTGGGSGIGRAVSLRLARDGAAVAIGDVNLEGAEETLARIAAAGGRGLAVRLDVCDAAGVAAAVAAARDQLGAVNVLANVAGIGEFLPFTEMSEAQWDRMIAVHLKGTYNCARAVVGEMLAAGWGRIVNTASVAGLNGGGPGLSHYAAAKGGIIAFTKALAQELGPGGITVNCIAPGLIDTPMVAGAMVSPEIRKIAVDGAPVRRIGQPEDVAAAVSYLVSEEAGFVTGQVLSPNGGRYM